MVFAAEHVQAAARRLRGVLVDTPLIGGLLLPGHAPPAGLRVKPECLQPGGSVWFRGAMHALARRLGAPNGVIAAGAFRPVLAAVVAAGLQRIPSVAVLRAELASPERAVLEAAGAGEIHVLPDDAAVDEHAARLARARGLLPMPSLGDADHDLGIATVGLELARDAGADVGVVLVSPGGLAGPIAAGLAAGERAIDVVPIIPDPGRAAAIAALRDALDAGVRLSCDPAGLAALDAALGGRHGAHPCVVLSC